MRISLICGRLDPADRTRLEALLADPGPHALELADLSDRKGWEHALRTGDWAVVIASEEEKDAALAVFRPAVLLGRHANVMRSADPLRLKALLSALASRESWTRTARERLGPA